VYQALLEVLQFIFQLALELATDIHAFADVEKYSNSPVAHLNVLYCKRKMLKLSQL
jgi:hypothetical protein